jgi:hypothetical protein
MVHVVNGGIYPSIFYAQSENGSFFCGLGSDTLVGSEYFEELRGDEGDDTLRGYGGDDAPKGRRWQRLPLWRYWQ